MRTDDSREDPILRAVSDLPVRELDHRRAERIRTRCHAALGRPTWTERLAANVRFRFDRPFLESAVVSGVSGVYLTEVVRRALHLCGM